MNCVSFYLLSYPTDLESDPDLIYSTRPSPNLTKPVGTKN